MSADRDAVAWLRMMARYSIATDSRPTFDRIADELETLRAEIARLTAAPAGSNHHLGRA